MDISGSDPVSLFGLHDKNIQILDRSFPEVKINARGNRVKVIGSSEEVDLVKNIIEGMIGVADRKGSVSENEVKTLITLKSGERKARTPLPKNIKEGDLILYTYDGIPVHAKTPGQKRIVTTSNQSDILFSIGPAGTGKTYTSVALAVKAMKEQRVKKIILAIITGDVTQTDLPRKQESGLITVQDILKDVDGIDFVYLSEEDVVRHKLVKDIINAYEKFES